MKMIYLKTILITFLLMIFSLSLSAQDPGNPPPPPSSPSGGNNLPVGGGAPVDGGLVILLALGLGYGIKKINIKTTKC